jgi:hypothetical protein
MMSRRRLFARMRRRVELLFTRLDLRMHNGNLKELVKNSINVYAEKTDQRYANGTAMIAAIENSELQLGRERAEEMIYELLMDEEGALTKDDKTESGDPR